MKKILLFLFSLVILTSGAMAQDAKAGKSTRKEAKADAKEPQGRTKKDGTPDKRFKENKKTEAAPAGPLKKDGTPDKRYNANKKGSAAPKQK
jgi:hypothetical protein